MTSILDKDERRPAALRFPVDAAQRAAWQRRLNGLPLLTHLGAALDFSDPAVVRGRFVESLPAHIGGMGARAINGAVIAALMDCGIAATGILLLRGRTCGTLQMSIDFMKPVRDLRPVLEFWAVRRTDTLVFVEARLCDARGIASVKASGIVALGRLAAQGDGSWNELFADQPDGIPLPATPTSDRPCDADLLATHLAERAIEPS